MEQSFIREDLLPITIPIFILGLIAVVAIVGWVLAHVWLKSRADKFRPRNRFLIVLPVATIASWAVIQCVGRFFFLACHWHVFIVALLAAGSIEGVTILYEHERKTIKKNVGRRLVGCRVAAIVIVLFVLLQPILVGENERVIRRTIAVLVDDSDSMNFVDQQMSLEQKLEIAYLLDILKSDKKDKESLLKSFESLTEDQQANLLSDVERTRAEIVRRLIGKGGEDSFINRLSQKYDVAIYRFGSSTKVLPAYRQLAEDGALPSGTSIVEADENLLKSFRSTTDISKAIETIYKEIPSEQLAGILIFSDGQYTAEAGIDSLTRKLGGLDIPVSTVVVGGTVKPFDVTIAAVNSPESVFLGDKIRFSVQINATEARNKETKVSLYLDDALLKSENVRIGSDDWSQEFKFDDTPEKHGVLRYKVVVDEIEDEEFIDNNQQIIDVSVSDDRTNVLLVDSRPRWEFRYLRNLFYGRDKSVHLQEILINPDRVEGLVVPKPPASASRKFGDSESGSFPRNREEWRKFDVIILGDLGPNVLSDKIVEELKYCVKERGALLVFIAGRNYFPHKFSSNSSISELIPVEYDYDSKPYTRGPEASYEFTLTPAGRGHQVMSQSASTVENEEIWSDLPDFTWRFPVKGIKPGAEVLAYARSKDFNQESFTSSIATAATENPEEAIRRLEELRKEQERKSLIVSRSLGRGKILMLNTDNTWRLRYRVGDTRHHRFWGQVLRWGAGEKLRAGNTYVRLGTDQLRYAPDEKIKIFARIVDQNYNTIDDLSPKVYLFNENGTEIGSYSLEYREDSNGFYDVEIPEIAHAGVYDIKLSCSDAEEKLGRRFPKGLSTKFYVVTAKQPLEFVNVVASDTTPKRMAEITKGDVLSPLEFIGYDRNYGEGNKLLVERTEVYLWDSWILFVLVILCLTYEWILRKRVGLV